MTVDRKEFEDPRYSRAYSDENFWKKVLDIVKKGGEHLVFLALQLFYVMKSDDVPVKKKLAIAGALGYLILPTDLIPDFLPVVGYTDDFAAMMAAYGMVKACVSPKIKSQAAQKCHEWFSDFDESRYDFASADFTSDGDIDEQ